MLFRSAPVKRATLRDEVRSLGLTLRVTDGEYRVAFPYNERSAYYTTDPDDALATARAMARERDSFK